MKLTVATLLAFALLTSVAANAGSFPQPSPKHGAKFWAYQSLWFSGN